MAFKSQAQRAKFLELVAQGKMKQSTFDEFEKATPKGAPLPERLTPKKPPITSIQDLRDVAKNKFGR